MSDGAGAGLYGKVATQPDFLRVGAGAFCQAGLDRWLQEGVELLRAERTQCPTEPTAFLLVPSGAAGASAFLGVLAASADAAGRSFPLAVFSDLSSAEARETLPALPAAYGPFVRDASALLSSAPSHDGAVVTRGAQALLGGPPGPPTLAEPHAWKNEPVRALLATFGGSPQALAYALQTLVTACGRAAEGAATAANALTIEAPVQGPATSALWLAIARGRLGWREATPSLLWTAGPEGRLLITLGPPSPAALAFLANPRHRSARLWPLRTTVASAADEAWAALGAQQRQAIEDPDATFGDLAEAFG